MKNRNRQTSGDVIEAQAQHIGELKAELAHYKATELLPEEIEQLQADHDSWNRMQKQDEIELARVRHHIEAHANAGCQYCRALIVAEPPTECVACGGAGRRLFRSPPCATCAGTGRVGGAEPQPQETECSHRYSESATGRCFQCGKEIIHAR